MFVTYILQSQKTGKYYIGSTQDLTKRIKIHNQNKVASTKNKGPWTLIYTKYFMTRSEACRKELEIKSFKGGNSFPKLVKASR